MRTYYVSPIPPFRSIVDGKVAVERSLGKTVQMFPIMHGVFLKSQCSLEFGRFRVSTFRPGRSRRFWELASRHIVASFFHEIRLPVQADVHGGHGLLDGRQPASGSGTWPFVP